MEKILNLLHKPKTEFIICGDFNINYMEGSNNRKALDNLLTLYNLMSTVYFPTRIVDNSIYMIDNIFIDVCKNYTIEPYINGLSDHDVQVITIGNTCALNVNTNPYCVTIINKNSIAEFQLQLGWESWEGVFGGNDVNLMFNNFLNRYLRYYHSSFFLKKRKHQDRKNQWITTGIRVSCNRRKELFLLCRLINNHRLKIFYKNSAKVCLK